MTDITELAQSMKAAADREMICRDGAETSEIWERTVTPENILALVEALEKAQQRIAELEQKHCGGALMERELAHSEVIYKLMYEIDNRDSRIAELESRTVKLPKLKMLEDYLAEVAIEERKQILVGVKLEFHRALAAAGIKVEAE
ncbi:hypothetical protein [Klebsiella pneumoniae]|uniref:hypothetical protein n=1 Tax=Klebsiella pneumoniae TaxID=573 RepID=UPI003A9824C5